jgi:hypothetical protein
VFAVEFDFVEPVNTERSEGAETNVERDAGDFDAASSESFKRLRGEVQASSGSGNGTWFAGEDGLVAVAILLGVVASDVGREGHVTDAVEDGEEVGILVIYRGELEQALTELAAFEDLGFEEDFAGERGKDQALADGNFAAGTDEGAPEVVACWLSEHDFDLAGWGLTVVAEKDAAGVEAGWNYSAVVEDEKVAGLEERGEGGKG